MTSKQKGGIMLSLEPFPPRDRLKKFLASSDIEYRSRGLNGFVYTCVLNDDKLQKNNITNDMYYSISPDNKFGEPVKQLIIKLCFIKPMKQTYTYKEKLFQSLTSNEFQSEFKNQNDVFKNSMSFLQPICPSVVYYDANYTEILNIIEAQQNPESSEDKKTMFTESINFLKQFSMDPPNTQRKKTINKDKANIGVIAMEMIGDYNQNTTLFEFLKQNNDKNEKENILNISRFLLIELARLGYNHNDFHRNNFLVTKCSNYFDGGPNYRPYIIDFGRTTSILQETKKRIEDKLANSNYAGVLLELCNESRFIKKAGNYKKEEQKKRFEWVCGENYYEDAEPNAEQTRLLNNQLTLLYQKRNTQIEKNIEIMKNLHQSNPRIPILPVEYCAFNFYSRTTFCKETAPRYPMKDEENRFAQIPTSQNTNEYATAHLENNINVDPETVYHTAPPSQQQNVIKEPEIVYHTAAISPDPNVIQEPEIVYHTAPQPKKPKNVPPSQNPTIASKPKNVPPPQNPTIASKPKTLPQPKKPNIASKPKTFFSSQNVPPPQNKNTQPPLPVNQKKSYNVRFMEQPSINEIERPLLPNEYIPLNLKLTKDSNEKMGVNKLPGQTLLNNKSPDENLSGRSNLPGEKLSSYRPINKNFTRKLKPSGNQMLASADFLKIAQPFGQQSFNKTRNNRYNAFTSFSNKLNQENTRKRTRRPRLTGDILFNYPPNGNNQQINSYKEEPNTVSNVIENNDGAGVLNQGYKYLSSLFTRF